MGKLPCPEGCKLIRVYVVLDVKHDGCHEARLACDGHLTDVPLSSVYSVAVLFRGIIVVLFVAELNHLDSWGTVIVN